MCAPVADHAAAIAAAAFATAAVRLERPTWTLDEAAEASLDESMEDDGPLAEVSPPQVRTTALPPLALEARRLPEPPLTYTLADDPDVELGASVEVGYGVAEPPPPESPLPQPHAEAGLDSEPPSSVEASPEHGLAVVAAAMAAATPSVVEPTDVPPDSVPPEQRPISRTAGLDASPPRATYFAGDNGDLFSRVRMSALRIPPPTNAAVARPATGNVSGGTEVGARVANLLEDLYGSDLVESPPPTAGAHPRARGAWD